MRNASPPKKNTKLYVIYNVYKDSIDERAQRAKKKFTYVKSIDSLRTLSIDKSVKLDNGSCPMVERRYALIT